MDGFARLQAQLVAALTAQLETGGVPRLPAAGLELWAAFVELGAARSWHGGGPNPLGFAEIEAYGRLMRQPFAPHHVRALRAMDVAWLAHAYARRDGKAKATQPVTAELFDAVIA